MSSYSLSNYYILGTDLLRVIPSPDYVIIFMTEIITIVGILYVFYYDLIIQLFAYYTYKPSLTKKNEDVMKQERDLISTYVNPKQKYKLVCTSSDRLGIKNLTDNTIIDALTIGGDIIPNCSKLINNI